MSRRVGWVAVSLALLLVATSAGAGKNDWIVPDSDSDPDPRFQTVARHLRGLDMAMVEIGYRYQEVYRGSQQQNWPYVVYQVTKIGLALNNALERRPKRSASAHALFFPELERFAGLVDAQDEAAAGAGFDALTASCNACHQAEGVASFVVTPPPEGSGLSVITAPGAN